MGMRVLMIHLVVTLAVILVGAHVQLALTVVRWAVQQVLQTVLLVVMASKFMKNNVFISPRDELVLVKPFIDSLSQQILDILKKENFVDAISVQQSFFFDLRSVWIYHFQKAFILELHQAKESGLLKGKTPEKRYAYFVEALSQEQNRAFFFKRYPVLKAQQKSFTKPYLAYFGELFSRLKQDMSSLKVMFGIDLTKQTLTSFKFLGDPHNHFRRVAVLEFVDVQMNKYKLIYKPRSIANESFFNKFVYWLNPALDQPLRAYQCLDKEDYGWCEYIEKKECVSEQEVKDYYYRFGMLTAIIYVLGVSDMHYENLIACGEDPIIIDLECMGLGMSEFINPKEYNHSVLNSGMLPNYMIERNAASDSSAFAGGGEECEIPFENSCLENVGRDDMYIGRKSGFFPLQANRPILRGKAVVPYHYKTQILDGFEKTYRAILGKQKKISKEFAPDFEKIHVRLVFRATSLYMKLINESYHPTLLKSQDAYQKHLEWFKQNFFGIQLKKKNFDTFVKSELNQIANHDIPLFHLKDSNIYDAYGNIMPIEVKQSFAESTMKKIKKLSLNDLKLQLNLMEKAIDTYAINYSPVSVSEDKKQNQASVSEEQTLNKVKQVLDQLLENCLDQEKWVWPQHKRTSVKDKYYWLLSHSHLDLYSGSVGVLLALSYACQIIPQKKYLDWFNQGLHFLESSVKKLLKDKRHLVDLSLLNGMGGGLYFCLHSLELDHGDKILCLIQNILILIDKCLERWLKTYPFDIISGIAGLILALDLCTKKGVETKKSRGLIKACKHFLLTHYPHPAKLPKKAHTENTKKAILGFSHGVSGIAYALYRTEDLTRPDQRILKWVKAALAYERKNFDLEYQGWANTFAEQRLEIIGNKKDLFQVDWCHGALGIGLSRLELKRLDWRDQYIDQEIAISVLAVKSAKPQTSLNLCHGALGRFDYCMRLHEEGLIDEKYFEEERSKLLTKIISSSVLVSEVRAEIFIPGLMTGQAGIVYELLRILYPEKVPSVLTID